MRIALRDIPPKFIAKYKLEDLAENGYILLEIRRGMYGLPHAGRIANDQLVEHLAKFGYRPTARTHGLWRHDTRDIKFCLCVDDFGVAYTNRQDVHHLLDALDELYEETTVDWKGETFLGMSIKWDYDARTASISNPARAVNPTILVALGTLASSQARPTEQCERHLQYLLDYVASHPNATITYHASDMKLQSSRPAGRKTVGCSRSTP